MIKVLHLTAGDVALYFILLASFEHSIRLLLAHGPLRLDSTRPQILESSVLVVRVVLQMLLYVHGAHRALGVLVEHCVVAFRVHVALVYVRYRCLKFASSHLLDSQRIIMVIIVLNLI